VNWTYIKHRQGYIGRYDKNTLNDSDVIVVWYPDKNNNFIHNLASHKSTIDLYYTEIPESELFLELI